MSIYASEELQRELEYQDMLDEKYGYDDYEDYLYEDNYDDDCIVPNKESKPKINKEKCKLVKFPINSDEINMKNKQCDYKTLAIMTMYSKINLSANEKHRYIYKEDILLNKDEIEKLSNNKINTICKNIKKLCKLESKVVEAKNTNNGIVYIINYATEETNSDGNKVYRKFVPIEEDILKHMMDTASSNVIKTYIFLKYRCRYNKNCGTKITRKEIAENIGLSPKSDNNLKTVYRCIKALEGNHLIKVSKKYTSEVSDNGNESVKCFNYFTIVSHDKWEEWFKNKN